MDDSPSSTNPITNDTDHDLADDNTDNLEVVDRLNPDLVADLVFLVALWPDSLEKGEDVPDREEDIPFREEAQAGNDIVPKIHSPWVKRIFPEHAPDYAKLPGTLGSHLSVDPSASLTNGQICPVCLAVIGVFWEERLVEQIRWVVGKTTE